MSQKMNPEAARLWNAYLAAKAGRSLAEMPQAEAEAACAIHEEFCRADSRIRVRGVNVGALQRAIDCGGDEIELPSGEIVRCGRTFLEGSREGLEEFIGWAEECGPDNIEAIYEMIDASEEFRAMLIQRSIEAVDRAADKVRSQIQ